MQRAPARRDVVRIWFNQCTVERIRRQLRVVARPAAARAQERGATHHDGKEDLTAPTSEARSEKKREIETKLILSSHYRGWTIAENLIAEKNVAHAPYEFGYSAGISRPFVLAARPDRCIVCPENFEAGVEVYGGLGTHNHFGFRDTAHYVAPTLAWTLADGPTLRVSPGFGLTGSSARFLLRFGVSYEIAQIGRAVRKFVAGRSQ